jgi:ubiquinone/menaquinone biosynthesis C-methylase UbiE
MQSFARHHRKSSRISVKETHGLAINLGWRYDLMEWLLDTFVFHGKLRELRQQTANLAHIQPGEKVLDVGCGTGTLALEVQQRVGATGRVFGIDPGTRQIARARSKAARRNLPIEFQVGVIEDLPFPDLSVDVVLSTIMMHHLSDRLKHQGLAEIARVLKPGGRLVIADFKGLGGDQQSPNQESVPKLSALILEAGFTHVETQNMPFPQFRDGIIFVSADKG